MVNHGGIHNGSLWMHATTLSSTWCKRELLVMYPHDLSPPCRTYSARNNFKLPFCQMSTGTDLGQARLHLWARHNMLLHITASHASREHQSKRALLLCNPPVSAHLVGTSPGGTSTRLLLCTHSGHAYATGAVFAAAYGTAHDAWHCSAPVKLCLHTPSLLCRRPPSPPPSLPPPLPLGGQPWWSNITTRAT